MENEKIKRIFEQLLKGEVQEVFFVAEKRIFVENRKKIEGRKEWKKE